MPTKSTANQCNRAHATRPLAFLVLAISFITPTWGAELSVPAALADTAVAKAVADAGASAPSEPASKGRPVSTATASGSTVAATGSSRKRTVTVARHESKDDGLIATPLTGNLTRMQDEIDTLEKADQIAGRKLSIAGKRQQIRKITSVDDSQSRLRGDMKVVGIEGPVGSLTATIRFASGEEIEVRSGDHLPDGRKVRSITSTGVSLATRNTVTNFPMTVASGKAIPARPDALPAERVLVPFGGSLPPPQGVNR